MLVTIAQINPHVGAITKNSNKIIECIETARTKHNSGLIIFPELVVTGYPPEDLLLRPKLEQQVESALLTICHAAKKIDVILGFPKKYQGNLHNACAYITGGKIADIYYKRKLPNYGVFDEMRYFQPGRDICMIKLDNIKTGLSICEDLWSGMHAGEIKNAGGELLININASPYYQHILEDRKKLLKQRAGETGLNIIYVNQVCGQDELVFDGGSMVIDSDGEIIFEAPQFEEGIYCVDIRKDNSGLTFSPGQHPPGISHEESIYNALILGIRDYVTKNGFSGVVIGLSGGVDSALTLALATDALGPDKIEVLLMPSRYTSKISIDDAKNMAQTLKVNYRVVPIEEPFAAFLNILAPLFKNLPADATEENIQARCRGILLMAVSNKTGKMVLTTGNKSEMAVGYATLYGDMAGGFAPLKDVSKTLVYALARWRNSRGAIIPQRIIDRPPSAELREDQKDEDSLPPYSILDPILERYIELDQSPQEIVAAGFDSKTVIDIVNMVDKNEYKRRQAAPGIKISKRAFGRDRRYPITSGYRES